VTTSAARQAEGFVQTPLFEGLARAGYVARGLIYIVIGICAIRVAEGVNGQPASQTGALKLIADQQFGHALLVLMAIGLGGYALWRLAQVVFGTTPEAGRHSTLDRVGALGSAVAYATFCFVAVSILVAPESTSGNDQKPRDVTADALSWPAGRWLVGAVGVLFLIVAGYQLYMGVSRKFLEDSKVGQMDRPVQRGFTVLGVVGLCARAVAFGLIGVFIVQAARDFQASKAVGLDGALARLTTHSYGQTLLVIVALGLIAFGVYSIADARFRKI
jgi:Domain of Unknown Function (DUF1206)